MYKEVMKRDLLQDLWRKRNESQRVGCGFYHSAMNLLPSNLSMASVTYVVVASVETTPTRLRGANGSKVYFLNPQNNSL